MIQSQFVRTAAVAGGILLTAIVLWDAFETIILSRRVSRKLRLTRLFYGITWGRELRAMYEPYAEALSRHLLMPLPAWVPPAGAPDNWQRLEE